MLVLKLEGAPVSSIMTNSGIIQLTYAGDFIAHLYDSVTELVGVESASDFAQAVFKDDGFSLEKPLDICLWSLEEKKAVVARVRKIRLTQRAVSSTSYESLPVCLLYAAELHQPRLSEILNAFTKERVALL